MDRMWPFFFGEPYREPYRPTNNEGVNWYTGRPSTVPVFNWYTVSFVDPAHNEEVRHSVAHTAPLAFIPVRPVAPVLRVCPRGDLGPPPRGPAVHAPRPIGRRTRRRSTNSSTTTPPAHSYP